MMRLRQLSAFQDGYLPYAYFLLLSIPEPFRSRMLAEQRIVDKILGKGKVNVSIPHISLPWFRWYKEDEEELLSRLTFPSQEFPAFRVLVNGFDRFKSHTLFWNIADFEMVQALSDTCCTYLFGNKGPRINRPHITLCKQLKLYQSQALWDAEYENRSNGLQSGDVFECDIVNLTLARAVMDVEQTKRTGRLIRTSKWENVKRFPLKGRDL